jgi:hypothetical protein
MAKYTTEKRCVCGGPLNKEGKCMRRDSDHDRIMAAKSGQQSQTPTGRPSQQGGGFRGDYDKYGGYD